VAYTLQVGRSAFNHRRMLVCADLEDAIAGLEQGRGVTVEQINREQVGVLVLPDGDHPICYDLRATEPVYREAVERCQDAGLGSVPRGAAFSALYSMAVLVKHCHAALEFRGSGVGGLVAECLSGSLSLADVRPRLAESTSLPDEHATSGSDRKISIDCPRDCNSLLEAVGALWGAGATIDWKALWGGQSRRRVSLPAYPFERVRYWIDPVPMHNTDGPPESAPREDIADWFYVPSWKRSATVDLLVPDRHTWLVLLDDRGVGAQLRKWLEERGQTVVSASAGAAYERADRAHYAIRTGAPSDYERLLDDMRANGVVPDRILHCWLLRDREGDADEDESDEELARNLELGFYSLLYLVKALGNSDIRDCRLSVVTTGAQYILPEDEVVPSKTTVLGPCHVIPQELLNITADTIDVELSDDAALGGLIDQLGTELLSPPREPFVALRKSCRWVQMVEPVKIDRASSCPRLRSGGVYLITGGLGGIGLAMAQHLASEVAAKIALVARTPLPPRDRWPDILRDSAPGSIVARRIYAVQSMESQGTEVLLLGADVSDRDQIKNAVRATVERFGALHGVLHTAGIPGVGIMHRKTAADAGAVFAPKIQGTRALAHALREVKLDFLVLFSSVATVTGGGPGQADYCAANTFLEAWAQRRKKHHGLTCAISWGEWQWDAWSEGLLGFPEEVRAHLISNRHAFGITFEQGAEVLERILSRSIPHIYVQNRDLNRDVEGSRDLARRFFEKVRNTRISRRYPRPDLAVSFVEPRNEREIEIAAVWREVLGVDPVGIDDNFFDMGGNSLIGLDLIARVRKKLCLDRLSTLVLYQAPTVRTLAAQLGKKDDEPVYRDWETRSEKRRQRLRKLGSQMSAAIDDDAHRPI
jgi:NAD(P)-dependent dehydrogenase (short-subunit alcohol dehydrogenase family)